MVVRYSHEDIFTSIHSVVSQRSRRDSGVELCEKHMQFHFDVMMQMKVTEYIDCKHDFCVWLSVIHYSSQMNCR